MQRLREVDGDENKKSEQQEQKPSLEEVEKAKNDPSKRVVETANGPRVLSHLRG